MDRVGVRRSLRCPTRSGIDPLDAKIYVRARRGTDPTRPRRCSKTSRRTSRRPTCFDKAEFKESKASNIDLILNLIYALLGLAIIIALMGITNTLALSIFERTRELGVLRALGMTRGQLKSTVRFEAMIIALFGTALGLRSACSSVGASSTRSPTRESTRW